MTEISIRNGIKRIINPNDFVYKAWDAVINKQYQVQSTTGSPSALYTFWSEYEMGGTDDMRTCYSTTDSKSALNRDFLPIIKYPGDTFDSYTLTYPLLQFSADSDITYNGTSDIFSDPYTRKSFVVIARCDVDSNSKQFILSIGRSMSLGQAPIWSLGDLHIYRDTSTSHDHLISRIGSSYKSSRINNFNMADVHVYAIEFDGISTWEIYLDNVLITSHTNVFTGSLWSTPNYNSSINTLFASGRVGYIHAADGASLNTSDVGIHAIVQSQSNATFSFEIDELCHYRYGLPNPPDTSHNSTANTTLGSSQVIVFGSYTFGGTQQFL